MKITKLEITKSNNIKLYINDHYHCDISMEVCLTNNLKKNQYIDDALLEKIISETEFIKAKSYALKTLSGRIYTVKELKNKIIDKKYSQNTANEVIKTLINAGLLDDELYARSYFSDAVNLRRKGPQNIYMELKSKGIDVTIIDKVFAENIIPESQINDNIQALIEKKRKKPDETDFHYNQRLYRFLIGKGYSYDSIKKVIKEMKNE